jgi:hypothetical protein
MTLDLAAILEARERWRRPGLWMWWALRRRGTDTKLAIRWARQRVVRGWDDRAVWSLGHHLAKTLGEQLVTLSEGAHGYPGDKYPYDRWTADLKRHGEALLAYHCGQFEAVGEQWDALYEPAREALVWVAENLGTLWD